MYLSKLTLDPRQPQARRDLGDPYEMHRTLARAFASDADTRPIRFLWRLERSATVSQASNLLVQANVPGQWSPIQDIPGYALEIQANKHVKLETFIEGGRRYRFRLYANPTVTRAGKRLGLVKEDQQLAWLTRQGERHGFSVLACLRDGSERIQVRQGNSGNRITVDAALFDGLLEVTDQGLLREVVQLGLGHARALGLGLLSLARAG